jgi:DNA polymerase/3'-5' exonuclease PolX
MKKENAEIYRQMEERRNLRAKRPISEKLAIAERLRDLQKALAPIREANRARRATAEVEIRIKTR